MIGFVFLGIVGALVWLSMRKDDAVETQEWMTKQMDTKYVWATLQLTNVVPNYREDWSEFPDSILSLSNSYGSIQLFEEAIDQLAKRITGIDIIIQNPDAQLITLKQARELALGCVKLNKKLAKDLKLDVTQYNECFGRDGIVKEDQLLELFNKL